MQHSKNEKERTKRLTKKIIFCAFFCLFYSVLKDFKLELCSMAKTRNLKHKKIDLS